MTENIQKFLELVSKNEELTKKLNGAVKEEIIAVAKAIGIDLSDADFEQASELSDDELDAVAGGGENTNGSVRCVCIIGGDGNW